MRKQKVVQSKPTTTKKSFLKWLGSKHRIADILISKMPDTFNTYHEPFLGSGSLFFALQPKNASLSDLNKELITTYTVVKENPELLFQEVLIHFKKHSPLHYSAMRKELSITKSPIRSAGIFIYLNKTCFNGLYRVNKQGVFNAAFAYKQKSQLKIDQQKLVRCSELLKNAVLKNCDYEKAPIRKSDFYYLDPPYHRATIQYSSKNFDEQEQIRLAKWCRKLDEEGAFFMLSNSNTEFIRELYKGFHIEAIDARQQFQHIHQPKKRFKELIIRNYR